jgi:Tol biopolymer transport system component
MALDEEKLLLKKADGVSDWSTDGKTVLYAVGNPFEVWALPMTGDKKPYPLVNQKFRYIRAKFSPDGRWFAYTSNESGRDEIYVQTFPPSGGKSQVSVNGGAYAYWRRDGKEIIFGTGDRKIMAVDVKLGTSFEAGVPRQLFEIPETMAGVRFAITADAQRFLIPLLSNTNRSTLTTVLNWTADIKK